LLEKDRGMPALRCPACGYSGQLPNVPREAAVKCRQCGIIFQASRPRWLLRGLLALPVFLLLGAGVSLLFHLQGRPSKAPEAASDAQRDAEARPPTDSDRSVVEQYAQRAADHRAERGKVEAELRELETTRARLSSAKAALDQERLDLDRQTKELLDRKAKLALEQAELKASAARTSPALTLKLEELERAPDKYFGQLLVCDGATIQGKSLDKYKELDRYTVTVVSRAGTFFSRVPLNGLFFSTTDRIALALPRLLNNEGALGNIRLYCEMRKYEKKSANGKVLPEAHIYRIDLFTTNGDHAKVLE